MALSLLLGFIGRSVGQEPKDEEATLLQDTLSLVAEVKSFGKSLGIEPSEALSQSTREKPAHSMLWLWLQRFGTLAVRAPIDMRIGLGFASTRDKLPLQQLYNAGGYSIYYRQGDQFGDQRSVITAEFARGSLREKAEVILHEDLHDDRNFDLPWEIEESIVTPLGALAALKFVESKGDEASAKMASAKIEEARTLSRELNTLVGEGQKLFDLEPLADARKKLVALFPSYPTYERWFKFQLDGQDPDTALEAKVSHDLAYYRYYDRIVSLYEKGGDLKTLIQDLKKIPRQSDAESVAQFLGNLEEKYSAPR